LENEYGNDNDAMFASSFDEKDTYYPILKRNKVRQNPQNFNAIQLKRFLSRFYLIKTPYGYALGKTYRPMTEKSNSREIKRNSPSWPKRQGNYDKVE
jgi:hypothetical protein